MPTMELYPDISTHPTLSERAMLAWERVVRVTKRMAIAFGLSTALAIAVGAMLTDNAFAQLVVTSMAAIGFWLPMLFVTLTFERFAERRRFARSMKSAPAISKAAGNSWQRLAAAAPAQRDRLLAIQRSLDQSHVSLKASQLDPDAHELCLLIERRLPELIEHELDCLPPDDRGRRRQVGELIGLVEQFARHCARKRDGDRAASNYQADVLRRRFEDRLSGAGPLDQ